MLLPGPLRLLVIFSVHNLRCLCTDFRVFSSLELETLLWRPALRLPELLYCTPRSQNVYA